MNDLIISEDENEYNKRSHLFDVMLEVGRTLCCRQHTVNKYLEHVTNAYWTRSREGCFWLINSSLVAKHIR